MAQHDQHLTKVHNMSWAIGRATLDLVLVMVPAFFIWFAIGALAPEEPSGIWRIAQMGGGLIGGRIVGSWAARKVPGPRPAPSDRSGSAVDRSLSLGILVLLAAPLFMLVLMMTALGH